MRALRVVGITEGGGEFSVVLEDPVRRERYTVPADEQLRAAARGDLTRLGQISIELESQLRPREIQARIRAGASVEQVAAAAGVPLQKIERFAYPVLLERSRTAEVAQRAHPMRADGPDTRTLGDVVAHTFGLRGQEYADAEWDSWKGEDGKWVVSLSWHAGRSDNRAHWTFQPGAHGGTVTAVDEHASDLIEGLPARPLRTVGPVIDIARSEEPAPAPAPGPEEELRAVASDPVRGARIDPPAAAEARTAERTPPRTAPEPRRPVPPTQRQAPAEPSRTEPAPAEADRDRRPRRQANDEAVVAPSRPERTEDARPGSAKPAARRDAPERRRPEPARPEKAPSAPAEPVAEKPAPAEPAEKPGDGKPAAEKPAEKPAAEKPAAEPAAAAAAAPPAGSKRTKKGKPVMPSWDEVLLGVRGQR
ncbi:septation protein SepH [Pseudonocardia zijingensis]|uniref:septation protein SepH n=1 Tax=Pseudonocardia zijingensis TaxID=153376 RepID=UPI00361FC5CE